MENFNLALIFYSIHISNLYEFFQITALQFNLIAAQ